MPTVLKIGAFRFFFYSDERNEPPHIHVETPDGECKFWIDPIKLAENKNVAPHIIRNIEKLIFEHKDLLFIKYIEYHAK